jgi:hypothetical protein
MYVDSRTISQPATRCRLWKQGVIMPVPEGIITTTEILQAVVPPEPEVEDTEEEAEDAK